jgi:peptidoglycan/LPS O-acetylase OafA/YrhL
MANDSRRAHLWPLDVVRLLTFTAVISVHAIAFTELPSDTAAAGAMMLLQFGREVFFTLSGFVLVYTTLGRPVPVRSTWRRRLPAVAVPYLAWTVIYAMVSPLMAPYPRFSWSGLGLDVIDGGAYYHLYFLLVTLQLYAVFPWLSRFVRATADRAVPILVAVTAVNLAGLAVVQYAPNPGGVGGWFLAHAYELLPTYAMYVLAGCYAACHLHRLEAVLRARPRRLVLLALAGIGVALGAYAVQLRWMAPRVADSVLQPAMAATCAAALILLALAAWKWADGRRRGARAVEVGSQLSFGVYLAHPLVLALLLNIGLGNGHQVVPAPLATVLAIMGAIAGASALTWVLQRTRVGFALTGRARSRRPPRDLTQPSWSPHAALTPAG